MDDEISRFLEQDENPFGWNHMHYIKNPNQSKALNFSEEPCIIISASGMAEAGRIKHHLFHHITNAANTILIVGYCAKGTLGETLVKKPETVKIFGEELTVRARIEVISSMSAHGDEPEMLQYHEAQDKNKLKKVFLVHGEPKRQEAFKNALTKNGYKNIEIPDLGAVFEI
jgi:metallo-beta-lactamase family protein